MMIVGLTYMGQAIAAPADTDTVTVQQLVEGVENTYKDVHSLRADFTQVRRDAVMGGEAEQKGRVQIEKPRKMRWEYTGPDASQVISDGSKLWIYTPALKQVIESDDLSSGGSEVLQLLDSLSEIDEHFEITLLGKGEGIRKSYEIELVPREAGAFQKARITVSKKRYTLERLVVVDPMGNEIEMNFSQVRLNVDLPDSAFQFEAPEGVQVIKSEL